MKSFFIFITLLFSLPAGIFAAEKSRDITAAVLRDFSPLYEIDRYGKPTGFAIDLLEQTAKKASKGIKYIIAENWSEAMELVRSKQADLIPGIGISSARRKEFLFSSVMECVPVSCFVRKSNSFISELDDLKDFRTAVIKESAAQTIMEKRYRTHLIPYTSSESALFALVSGEVDAFIFPKPVMEKKARKVHLQDKIKPLELPLTELKRGFLFHKDNRPLLNLLNPYLKEVVSSPLYKKLYIKWYGKPMPFWTAKCVFLAMLFLLAITIAFLIIWRNFSLAKINRNLELNIQALKDKDKILSKQKEYLNSLQKNTPDAMYLCNLKGKLIDVNSQTERNLNYTREELLSMTAMDIDVHLKGEESLISIWETITDNNTIKIEAMHRKKDGETFPVEVHISKIIINNENHLLGFARDLSERKKIEEQLRQSQKMQAIGQLAGGIAHDFNNLLSGIIGYADLSYRETKPGTLINESLEQVLAAADQAKQLVEQILTFSRQKAEKFEPVNLCKITQQVMKFLSASIPSSVTVETSIDKNTPIVLADTNKIHELVINLATNAVHAMDDRGTLLVTLKTEELTDPVQAVHELIPAGRYAVISVNDNGKGIPADIREKIFEPFFTTKEVGQGTGMGLSVVYGIIKSHQAFLDFISSEKSGTEFKLYFPESGQQPIVTNNAEQEIRGGSERILLVDDEPFVLNFTTQILTSLGYQVTAVQKSLDALSIFKENPDKFDLLFTDQTMPSLSGEELSRRILEIRPDLPILLCTGFSKTIDEEKSRNIGIAAFCMKPFKRSGMAATLRQVLDK